MKCKIVVENITGGFCATVLDDCDNVIASAAMTTRYEAIEKAKGRALFAADALDWPFEFEVCDLSAQAPKRAYWEPRKTSNAE